MVLLLTGKCNTGCFYCPLSQAKKGKDVIYANERPVREEKDIIGEAVAIGAEGTGITGGDPLLELERSLRYIRLLKSQFGKSHHIHLYTSTIERDAFMQLEEAGLDELRLHPPLKTWTSLERYGLERILDDADMDIGFEIPSLPDEEEKMLALIRYADDIGMDFVNINELEFSETNWMQLRERGYEVKDDISSAVAGSRELALKLLKIDVDVPLHFCSSSYKDRIQLRRRILRRAERVALPFDLITEEGMLYRGVIETDDPLGVLKKLNSMGVPDDLMRYDREKNRVELASWVLDDIADELPYPAYLVEEYPTADRLEVEREPLNALARSIRPR